MAIFYLFWGVFVKIFYFWGGLEKFFNPMKENPRYFWREERGYMVLNHILSTETESLDDSTITIDVAIVEVVKESTTLAYELCK